MVFGPALGSYLMETYNTSFVVFIASLIALLNVFFIVVAVPESLPYKQRTSTNCITWKKADPFVVSFFCSIISIINTKSNIKYLKVNNFFFKALGLVGRDRTVLILCLTVFLSYLPEAGEYSSLFVYLRLVSIKKLTDVITNSNFTVIPKHFYDFIINLKFEISKKI